MHLALLLCQVWNDSWKTQGEKERNIFIYIKKNKKKEHHVQYINKEKKSTSINKQFQIRSTGCILFC